MKGIFAVSYHYHGANIDIISNIAIDFLIYLDVMTNLQSRLLEFIDYLGIKKSQFEKECGLSNGFVDKSGDNTRRSSLDKISTKYPECNIDWLLTGSGKMLKEATSIPIKSLTSGVPYYNVDFIGGFDIILNDQTATPEYLIDFKEYNKATCWCNITGHSMEPEINHGDIIALKEIADFSFLPYGEVYAIITTNGMRTVKRIGPSSNPENCSLIPTNKSPEYGVQEIPRNYIYKVYQVLGSVKKF